MVSIVSPPIPDSGGSASSQVTTVSEEEDQKRRSTSGMGIDEHYVNNMCPETMLIETEVMAPMAPIEKRRTEPRRLAPNYNSCFITLLDRFFRALLRVVVIGPVYEKTMGPHGII